MVLESRYSCIETMQQEVPQEVVVSVAVIPLSEKIQGTSILECEKGL